MQFFKVLFTRCFGDFRKKFSKSFFTRCFGDFTQNFSKFFLRGALEIAKQKISKSYLRGALEKLDKKRGSRGEPKEELSTAAPTSKQARKQANPREDDLSS